MDAETTQNPQVHEVETDDEAYEEVPVTEDSIQKAQERHDELGAMLIPFGQHKDQPISACTDPVIWEISSFAVRGDRPNLSVKPRGRGICQNLPRACWIVHNHYPIVRACYEYLYGLRDAKFRKHVADLKAKNPLPGKCAMCGRGMPHIKEDRPGWPREFHKNCWHKMQKTEQEESGFHHKEPKRARLE